MSIVLFFVAITILFAIFILFFSLSFIYVTHINPLLLIVPILIYIYCYFDSKKNYFLRVVSAVLVFVSLNFIFGITKECYPNSFILYDFLFNKYCFWMTFNFFNNNSISLIIITLSIFLITFIEYGLLEKDKEISNNFYDKMFIFGVFFLFLRCLIKLINTKGWVIFNGVIMLLGVILIYLIYKKFYYIKALRVVAYTVVCIGIFGIFRFGIGCVDYSLKFFEQDSPCISYFYFTEYNRTYFIDNILILTLIAIEIAFILKNKRLKKYKK